MKVLTRFVIPLAAVALFVTAAAAQGNSRTVKPVEKPKVKVVKEGVGFDGIQVGVSTAADVIKKFGKNYRLVKHKKYSAQMVYPGGISFYYCQSDKKKEIFDIELRAPFRAKTSKGIVLSESTVEDVKKKYGRSNDGLEYRGVGFFYAKYRGRNVVTVIDIVENSGIRQCKEAK